MPTSTAGPTSGGTIAGAKPGLVIPTDAASFNPGYCPSDYNTCQTPQSPRSRFCCLARDGLSCCHNNNAEPKCCLFGGEQQVDLVPVYLTNPDPQGASVASVPSPSPVPSPSARPFSSPLRSAVPSSSPAPSRSPVPSSSPAPSSSPVPSQSPKPSPSASNSALTVPRRSPSSSPARAVATSYDPVLRPNRCYTADGLTEFACGGSTPQCCSGDAAPKCCACEGGQC
jgi:hypothetical protein